MKKLFILAIFATLFMVVNAQNSDVDRVLNYNETFYSYNGGNVDTLGSLTASPSWTYTVRKYNDSRVYPYLYIAIDSLAGTAADVTVLLQKKMFNEQSFSNVDTVTWAGSADTTFVFDVSTASKEMDWRVSVAKDSNNFKIGITDVNFKFVY